MSSLETTAPLIVDDADANLSAGALAPPASDVLTIIRPPSGWQLINLHELWKYRELVGFMTWRDIKVRYKQTVLGAAWAILQPAMMMIVFTIFFARMAQVRSGDVPYPLFSYTGLLLWTFFATGLANAGNSIVGSERLITKVYFPRLAVPLGTVAAAVVDFLIGFVFLLGLMVWYGVWPTWSVLLVPLVVLLGMLAAVGVGSLLAALNVAYRDFRYVIPFLVQLWMFATPTIYMEPADTAASAPSVGGVSVRVPSASARVAQSNRPDDQGALPDWVQHLLNLNPMTGLVAFFRASVLGLPLPWQALGFSTAVIGVMLVVGLAYFRHVEHTFADII